MASELTDCEQRIKDLHKAARLMGRPVFSGDRFSREAVEFLARSGVEIIGDDEDGWIVKTHGSASNGDTMIDALVAAIFAVKG